MNIITLEGLYYVVTILVSVGVLHNFFNTLTISNNIEIIFIRKPQRFLLKIMSFIKYFFAYNYICIVFTYVINSFKIGFSIADLFTYSSLLLFCDYVYLSLFEKTPLLKLYSNLVKRIEEETRIAFILFLSIILTIITHYLGKIIDNRIISILQFICIFVFVFVCNKVSIIKIKGKHFKINFIIATSYLTPLFIKLLLLLYNNTVFRINLESFTNKLKLSDVKSYIYKIYYNKDSLSVLIIFCILSLFVAIFCVKRDLNLPSFLIYKNKTWEIIDITIDKYAICHCDNRAVMIKIDIIKDNYFCEYSEGNYYFREKDDMREIKITDHSF